MNRDAKIYKKMMNKSIKNHRKRDQMKALKNKCTKDYLKIINSNQHKKRVKYP